VPRRLCPLLLLLALAAPVLGRPPATAAPPRILQWLDAAALERSQPSPDAKTPWPGRIPAADDRGIDVLHTDLGLTVDPGAGRLEGTATLTVRLLAPLPAELRLDLVDVMVASDVRTEGAPAAFVQAGDSLRIALPAAAAPGDTVSVTIDYAGAPPRHGPFFAGLMVRRHGDDTPDDPADDGPIVANVSQPYSAHSWFPCKDHPADKMTLATRLTIPADLTAVANGRRVGVAAGPQPGQTTVAYRTEHPIATYLVSIAVSNYATWDEPCPGALAAVPLQYFVFPEHRAVADTAFAPTCAMLQWLEDLAGPYPFADEKYAQAEFRWGGSMENQTVTHVGQISVIAGAGAHLVVVHELAHHWFGDSLTPAAWRDIWLSEGFARYSEALWLEATEGPAMMRAYMQAIGPERHPELFAGESLLGDPDPVLPNLVIYDKGAWVLHMLRHEIGEDAFFRFLRDYGGDPDLRGGTVTQAIMIQHASAAAGRDLAPFFAPWLETDAVPDLELGWHRTVAGGEAGLEITVTQLQTPLFPLTLDVDVTCGGETRRVPVRLAGSTTRITVPTWGVVEGVVPDPDDRLLLRSRPAAAPAPVDMRPRPNPSPGTATLDFFLERPAAVTVAVHDARGRRMGAWRLGRLAATDDVPHSWTWDGRDSTGRPAASGVYWIAVTADGERRLARLVLVR